MKEGFVLVEKKINVDPQLISSEELEFVCSLGVSIFSKNWWDLDLVFLAYLVYTLVQTKLINSVVGL